jgi:NAD-dependent SIR2 family protein deacetylase
VDQATLRAQGRLPSCPTCSGLARPNVLMFGDGTWDSSRTERQEEHLREWLAAAASGPAARIVIVECGAGTGVPTVRRFGESMASRLRASLIRLNVREPTAPSGGISLPLAAREGLFEIDRRL